MEVAVTRRGRWAALASATAIVVVASSFVLLRGGSTPVSVERAVESYRRTSREPRQAAADERASPSAVPRSSRESSRVSAPVEVEIRNSPGVRPLPQEGVYVYATSGGDEVDVLGGSRHSYPSETTITVRHEGCGLVERWDALEERWDERESCRTAEGDVLKRTTSYHEFFGRGDQRTLECTGFTYPAGFQPGSSWSSHCASDNTSVDLKLTAVGWEDVVVAGRPVRTMHVRVEARITGEQDGSSTRHVWGSVDNGLVVRERSELTSYSNQPVFGRTRYHEQYENRLVSLEPRR